MDVRNLPNCDSLLAAIDEGDDVALCAFVDLLEEHGHPLAATARHLAGYTPFKFRHDTPLYGWYNAAKMRSPKGPDDLPTGIYFRLNGRSYDADARVYDTRSAAYLDLLRALDQ